MKKLFAFLFVLTSLSFAQVTTSGNGRYIWVDLGTVANSADETNYVSLPNWRVIDSISVTFAAKGEVDIDSLTVYGVVTHPATGQYVGTTVLGNFTVTLNLAAGVEEIEQLYTSNATLLTGAALRGLTGLKLLTRGATAGCDATDPDRGVIFLQVWGTP